jgi:putative Holliday junction resolvase
MRRLGVDPGSARVGLAVSDEDGRLASPLRTVPVRPGIDVAAEIAAAARDVEAGEIVVGLPISLDGVEREAARRARALAARVAEASGLRVVLWDERLSTAEAHRALAAQGHGERARRGRVDRAAAAIVLQAYLDARRARRAARRRG